jgi:galactitol-specific phosphotransferase system IIB component
MNRKVAVEKNLQNVKEYFEKKGYEVDTFDDTQIERIGTLSDYRAVIVSGGNIDFLGIEDTNTKAPVINAKGMSPESILNRLES